MTRDQLIVISWLICGFLSMGFFIGYFQNFQKSEIGRQISQDSYRQDIGMAVLFGIAGPVALLTSILLSGFGQYGWSLRRRR